MLGIVVANLEEEIAALGRVQGALPLMPYLTAGADLLIMDARTYPPELPNQRYVRTGDLGAGWRREVAALTPRLIALDVVNLVPYGPRVQGDDDQEAPFAGRWSTESELLAAAEDQIAGMLEDGLTMLLEGYL